MVKIRVTMAQRDALMNLAHERNTTFSVYARKVLLKDIEDTHAWGYQAMRRRNLERQRGETKSIEGCLVKMRSPTRWPYLF